MADNSSQTGTDSIATDDLATINGGASSGVKVQRVKPGYGVDGDFRDVSSTYPLPTVTPNSYVTGTITAANANLLTTSAATAGSTVQITVPDGHSSGDVFVTGTFSAGTMLYSQGSLDGSNWFSLNGRRNTDASTNDTTNFFATDYVGGAAPTGSNPSNWRVVLGAVRYYRVTCGTYTASDSVTVQIATSAGVGATFMNNKTTAIHDASTLGTITSVSLAATSFTALAANTTRKGVFIYNDSANIVYLGITASAVSTTAYSLQIPPNGFYELPVAYGVYTGQLTAISAVASGALRVTELT